MKKEDFDNTVANNEAGTLARLWKNILLDNNLTSAIGYLATKYVAKTARMNVKNVKRYTKSSILHNVNAKEMTWKTFTNLLFNYLNVKKIDITIKLTLSNGDETFSNVSINSDKMSDEGEKDETKREN